MTLLHLLGHWPKFQKKVTNRQTDKQTDRATIIVLVRYIIYSGRHTTPRYTRVRYEELLEAPRNTTGRVLDRLVLPWSRETAGMMEEVDRQQQEQFLAWTGDPDR